MPVETLRILLVVLLALPAAAAAVVALLGSRRASAVRWVSLLATVVDLILAAILAVNFADYRSTHPVAPGRPGERSFTFHPEFVPGAPATPSDTHRKDTPGTTWNLLRFGSGARATAIQFYIGLDGLNVFLVVLTAVLMVSSVLISWTAIQERVPEFYAWLLALQTALLGVFLSFDILLFYVFFELTLVPLFFLIGIWGGPQRRYAARKFFIYTLSGSLITLLGVLGIVVACSREPHIRTLTFSLPQLVSLVNEHLTYLRNLPADALAQPLDWHAIQFWVFLALITGFAIKVPLVPLHTWLPLAHVEAPTAGSVILAGVLLKIGAYGFLRLCLPLAPEASVQVGVPLIGWLAVIGIVYGAFCALSQSDIKKLVAYSSVSHLGFCMLGMFALNGAGLSGSMLQMINHGLSTGALFLLVGMLYERYHTRLMADYGGMGKHVPLLSLAMVFICLTSIGLPGLNGFVGEVLILMGMFDFERTVLERWPVLAVIGSTGIVLGAWYLLTMLMRVFFGPVKVPHVGPEHENHGPQGDLALRELAALVPIMVLCVAIGVYPQPFLNTIKSDMDLVRGIVEPHEMDLVGGSVDPHVVPGQPGPSKVADHSRREQAP